MWLCKYDLSKKCEGKYGNCIDCVLDKIKAEIKHFMYDINPSSSESDYACNYILDILDKYKIERERGKNG